MIRNLELLEVDLLEEICTIHEKVPQQWGYDGPMQVKNRMKQAQAQFKSDLGSILVYELDGHLLGFCWVEIDEQNTGSAMIRSTWTDENHRKKGIATELKKIAEKWAIEKGCNKIITCVHARNPEMLLLNEKLGYEKTMIHMEKTL